MTERKAALASYKLKNGKIFPTDKYGRELTRKEIAQKKPARIALLKERLVALKLMLNNYYTELGENYDEDYGCTITENFSEIRYEKHPTLNLPSITTWQPAPAFIDFTGDYPTTTRALTIDERLKIQKNIKIKRTQIACVQKKIDEILPTAKTQQIRESTAAKRVYEKHTLKEKYIEEYKTSRIKSKRSFAENRKKDSAYAHLKMDTLRRWLIGVSKVVIPQ